MFETEIRWFSVAPLALLLGLLALFCEIMGVWGGLSARPDLFWCLALCATMKTPPTTSMLVFLWCGLARDATLGPKMGAAAISFVLSGWLALYWKPVAADHGPLLQAPAAGISAFFVSLVRHGLSAGPLFGKVWRETALVSVGDALLTGIAYIPAALIFGLPWFRPWRRRQGYF